MDQMISVDPTIFHCPTKKEFLEQSDIIAGHLSSRGYAIVEAWDAECATVTEVAERFGRVQSHIRADANGIVGISPDTVVNHEWENYRSEYHGVSSEEFLPHTDGSYLQGLVRHGDEYIRLLPPQMLVLQCWQPATSGGASVLIDVQRIFDDLAERDPQLLDILSTNGCVSYCRDDQIALDCAVFQELDDGTIMLRFRYDSTVYVADWARDAFDTLQRDYFSDPRYQDQGDAEAGPDRDHRQLPDAARPGFLRCGRAGQEAQHASCVARARPLAGSAQCRRSARRTARAEAVPGVQHPAAFAGICRFRTAPAGHSRARVIPPTHVTSSTFQL